MGYDVHITRADDWVSNEGCAIEPSEWLDLVEHDESLCLAGYNGPYFVIWNGDPSEPEAWLDLYEGNITTKSPDEPLLGKMLEIANRLGAKVQGDEGEIYDGTALSTQTPSLWGNTSLLSLILSLVALAMLVIAIPLDSYIRQHYPVGTPIPLKWALVLVGPVIVGVLSWLVGIVFATAAFVFRQPSLWYAGVALAINCATGAYFAVIQ